MTSIEFEKAQQCHKVAKANLTGDDGEQVTVVPTYTMDLLVSSLKDLQIAAPRDKVFILKIDTEGHDAKVIKGSSNLLDQKRIIFVLFEVWTNSKLKEVATFMYTKGYMCFLFTPKQLLPVNGANWWYKNLEEDLWWWGNGKWSMRHPWKQIFGHVLAHVS